MKRCVWLGQGLCQCTPSHHARSAPLSSLQHCISPLNTPNQKPRHSNEGCTLCTWGAGGFTHGGLCTRTEVQKAHPYVWGLPPTQAAHPMRGVACVSGLCTAPQGQPIHMTGGSPIRVTESPLHDRAALPYGRGVGGGWAWRGPRVAWPLRVRGLPCSCDCGPLSRVRRLPLPHGGAAPPRTRGRLSRVSIERLTACWLPPCVRQDRPRVGPPCMSIDRGTARLYTDPLHYKERYLCTYPLHSLSHTRRSSKIS